MKIRLSELRKLIREVLLDEAASVPDASAALLVHRSPGGKVYILYNPSVVDVETPVEEQDVRDLYTALMAVIEVDHDGQVHSPAAVGGYGPFMYDVAMKLTPGGIWSDRVGASPTASRVWKFYMDAEKRPDVKHEPLPAESRKMKKDDATLELEKDPEDFRNYRFSFSSPDGGPDISVLLQNHEVVVKNRKKIGDDRFWQRLWGQAHEFFKKRENEERMAGANKH